MNAKPQSKILAIRGTHAPSQTRKLCVMLLHPHKPEALPCKSQDFKVRQNFFNTNLMINMATPPLGQSKNQLTRNPNEKSGLQNR